MCEEESNFNWILYVIPGIWDLCSKSRCKPLKSQGQSWCDLIYAFKMSPWPLYLELVWTEQK